MSLDSLICPEFLNSSLHKSFFLTVGRALAVAQHFENVCRGRANALDIRSAVISGTVSEADVGFDAFVEKVMKRMLGSAVEKIGNHAGSPADLCDLLNAAKDARNRIAHGCTISVCGPFWEDDETVFGSLELMLSDVRTVAAAATIISKLNFFAAEQKPLLISHDYVETVIAWVFEEFQGEDFLLEPTA